MPVNLDYTELFKTRSKAGKIGAKVTNTRYGGWSFISDETRRKNAKIALQKNKKNKKDAFHNKKIQRKNALKAHLTCKKNKLGFWNSRQQSKFGKIGGKKSARIQRKNKTGAYFDPILNKKIRKIFYLKRGTYKFKNILFDSKPEMEMAMNIHYQLDIKLCDNINCHYIFHTYELDFKLNKYKCIIEVHPFSFHKKENYFHKRRKILNKGGLKDFNLIVTK
jgi:hypothetical protein